MVGPEFVVLVANAEGGAGPKPHRCGTGLARRLALANQKGILEEARQL